MKKVISIILVIAMMMLMLVGCGGSTETATASTSTTTTTTETKTEAPAAEEKKADPVELTIATIYATSHPSHIACEAFASKLEELSDGQMTVVIYPNSQMGSESEIVQQVVNGDLDISCSGGGMWASYVPAASVFECLFMFRSVQEQLQVMTDKDVVGDFNELVDGSGIHCIGWLTLGSRYLLSNTPVRTADDFKGLSIRVPDNKVFVSLFNALECNPTIVPWGDVYTALSSGMVEACEADMANLSNSNLQETTKYLTKTGHITATTLVSMNEAKWNSLTEEQQAWVLEAFAAATPDQVQSTIDNQQTYFDQFEEAGIEFIELSDEEMGKLQSKALPVTAEIAGEYGLSDWVNGLFQ